MPGETTPTDTAAATKETTTTNKAYATNIQQVQNRGNINIKDNRTIMDTEDKSYKGETPNVNRIIDLRTENITKKIRFDTFREKLATYTNKDLTHATDVVCVVKHMKDPKINSNSKNKPKYLTEEEARSSMNKMIQDKEVKKYVNNRQAWKSNLNKYFDIIWGQCTSGVQSILKGESNF